MREGISENDALKLANKKTSNSLFTDIVTNFDTVKIKNWLLDMIFCSAFVYLMQDFLKSSYENWNEPVTNGLIENEFLKKNPFFLGFSIIKLVVDWFVIFKTMFKWHYWPKASQVIG